MPFSDRWAAIRGTLSIFLSAHPQLHKAIVAVGVATGTAIAFVSVVWESDIQLLRNGELRAAAIVLVCLLIFNAMSQLMPLLLGPAALRLDSFSELARDLRMAIMLRPVGELGTWTPTEWRERFDILADMVERQVAAVLDDPESAVACNMMVAFPPETSIADLEALRAAIGAKEDERVEPAYPKEDEGVRLDGDLEAILFLCGRGPTARKKRYPWIVLRVPHRVNHALPGAPRAYWELKSELELHEKTDLAPIDYVSHPKSVAGTDYSPSVSLDRKHRVAGYFTGIGTDVGSFVSIGLSFNRGVVGVLNVDSSKEDFLADPVNRRIVFDLVQPYSEIAGSLAFLFSAQASAWASHQEVRQGVSSAEAERTVEAKPDSAE